MAVTRSRRDVLHLGYGTAAALGVSALASAGALGPVRALAQGAPAVHMPAEDLFYREEWFGEPWRKPETAVLIHGNEESSLVWYAWMPRMGQEFSSSCGPICRGSVIADPRGVRVVAAEPCRVRSACYGQGGRRLPLTSSAPKPAARSLCSSLRITRRAPARFRSFMCRW